MPRRTSDFDLAALHAALDAKRRAGGLTWLEAARVISRRAPNERPGISPSTLAGVGKRAFVEGDGVLQMLLWLDRTPESFMRGVADADSPAYRLSHVAEAGKVLRFDTAKIHRAIAAARAERGLSWEEVAADIPGASVASLKALSREHGRVGFPQVGRITRWLDRPIAEFTRVARRRSGAQG